jgi:dihydrofolate synthase / folylpolyglutamate synthase
MTPFQEFREYLKSRLLFGMKAGLENTMATLERLGNPQRSLRVIHVAGTNGKGTTSYYLSRFLAHKGFTTGLYTSPHLVSMRERIQINHQCIPEEACGELGLRVKVAAAETPITYFEVLTCIALLYFAQQKVDWVVLEVGLGGRLDATNVCSNEWALLTSIGLDHQAQLGATAELILQEKMGVWKPAKPFYVGCAVERNLHPLIMEQGARLNSTPLFFSQESMHPAISQFIQSVPGSHLRSNIALALHSLMDQNVIQPEEIPKMLPSGWVWPGRLQKITDGIRGELWLDGAHNPQGMQALVHAIGKGEVPHPQKIYCSFLREKQYLEMLHMLADGLDVPIILTASTHQHSLNGQDVGELHRKFPKLSFVERETCLQEIKEQPVTMLCCGSLYFIGDVVQHLRLYSQDCAWFKNLAPDTNEWK